MTIESVTAMTGFKCDKLQLLKIVDSHPLKAYDFYELHLGHAYTRSIISVGSYIRRPNGKCVHFRRMRMLN